MPQRLNFFTSNVNISINGGLYFFFQWLRRVDVTIYLFLFIISSILILLILPTSDLREMIKLRKILKRKLFYGLSLQCILSSQLSSSTFSAIFLPPLLIAFNFCFVVFYHIFIIFLNNCFS